MCFSPQLRMRYSTSTEDKLHLWRGEQYYRYVLMWCGTCSLIVFVSLSLSDCISINDLICEIACFIYPSGRGLVQTCSEICPPWRTNHYICLEFTPLGEDLSREDLRGLVQTCSEICPPWRTNNYICLEWQGMLQEMCSHAYIIILHMRARKIRTCACAKFARVRAQNSRGRVRKIRTCACANLHVQIHT